MSVRHRVFPRAIFWRPLISTGGTLGQLPVIVEQVLEKIIAPLSRRRGPSHFEAAADGVSAVALAEFVLPSEALIVNVGTFRFGTDVVGGNSSAVSFAERMSTGNQRDRFFVVHGHALEGFANVPARRDGIGLSIGPFWLHVDQTHLHCTERFLKIAISTIAFVRQPRAFRTPIHFFGLPHIGASATKTKCLEAH